VILTPAPESAAFFAKGVQGRVRMVGYPLREAVTVADREAGLAHFKLDPARKTLLAWGGSRGARAINEALMAILPELLTDGLQIIHVSGETDWPKVAAQRDALFEALPYGMMDRYQAHPYLREDVGMAMAAADLTVSRAGASTLGEYPHFGLPAILVPLDFAWRHQRVNAEWLAARGAAVVLDNDHLLGGLLPAIRALVNDPARLAAMRAAMGGLARADVAGEIAQTVLALARG
jgi:UDP-N-acetylglucosamine--N-acetylmuramyl-(pentapeptide) pyrophosphoryl-undecaprenol N-acetylglucosamine transferase